MKGRNEYQDDLLGFFLNWHINLPAKKNCHSSDGHKKSFECKLLDLLLTKLDAHRFGQNHSILSYYIFHRNSTVSVLVKIELHSKTPGVSQRYVLCRMLFCFY